MSQGLFDESEEEEEQEGENILYSKNPPVSYEDRITKARKRRKKERKEQVNNLLQLGTVLLIVRCN